MWLRGRELVSRLFRTLIATSLVVPAMGCASASPDVGSEPRSPSDHRNTDVFLTKEEVTEELRSEMEKLTFPAGFEPPDHVFDRDPDDAQYQQGLGATEALQIALCAWGREALEYRETDPALSQEALESYEQLTQSETVRRYYDESAVRTDAERVQHAKLGDWAGLQWEADDQCAYYFADDPSAFTNSEDQ